LDLAGPGRHRSAPESIDAKHIERDRGADDVGDAVERPDLMEVHLLDRMPMYGRLGPGEPAKDVERSLTLLLTQLARVDDRLDLRQVAVFFLIRRLDAHLRRREASLADLLDLERDRQPERREPFAHRLHRHASVEENRQRHVAADAAEAIEVS